MQIGWGTLFIGMAGTGKTQLAKGILKNADQAKYC